MFDGKRQPVTTWDLNAANAAAVLLCSAPSAPGKCQSLQLHAVLALFLPPEWSN